MRLLLFLLLPALLPAQWHDAHWHFSGYTLPHLQPNSPKKSVLADFRGNEPGFQVLPNYLPNTYNSMTMSDAAGELIFYSNGIKVFDRQHALMENGDSINAGVKADEWVNEGYRGIYNLLCLPMPNDQYWYFHVRFLPECPDSGGEVLYTVIDMNANGGLGRVAAKNQFVKGCNAHFWAGLSATRHANGRDWWVVATFGREDKLFRFRLGPEGVGDTATVALSNEEGYHIGDGRSRFSPDGSKFVYCTNSRFVRLYDFDRCTGGFGNFQEINTESDLGFGLGIGSAFSAKGEHLYLCSAQILAQAKVDAPNLAETLDTVAIYDGFYEGFPAFGSYFSLLQLFPDGAIYGVAIGNNATRYLHRIKHPERAGAACAVRQHEIMLPVGVTNSLPYFPNYRLGPLDGSPCDTLGIDNLPLAHFRWDTEDSSAAPLAVTFTDLSAYGPTSWHWGFGDGGVSQDSSPVHAYAAPGVYEVCLAVCNPHACDTLCREVRVGLTGAA
jgi:hypothetical protein